MLGSEDIACCQKIEKPCIKSLAASQTITEDRNFLLDDARKNLSSVSVDTLSKLSTSKSATSYIFFEPSFALGSGIFSPCMHSLAQISSSTIAVAVSEVQLSKKQQSFWKKECNFEYDSI